MSLTFNLSIVYGGVFSLLDQYDTVDRYCSAGSGCVSWGGPGPTSGAIQNGVPTEVFLLSLVLVSWADTPGDAQSIDNKIKDVITHNGAVLRSIETFGRRFKSQRTSDITRPGATNSMQSKLDKDRVVCGGALRRP